MENTQKTKSGIPPKYVLFAVVVLGFLVVAFLAWQNAGSGTPNIYQQELERQRESWNADRAQLLEKWQETERQNLLLRECLDKAKACATGPQTTVAQCLSMLPSGC